MVGGPVAGDGAGRLHPVQLRGPGRHPGGGEVSGRLGNVVQSFHEGQGDVVTGH